MPRPKHHWRTFGVVMGVTIAVLIAILSCGTTRDVDLRTGRARDGFTFFGYVVSREIRDTRFSSRYKIQTVEPEMWVRVYSVETINPTSPNYRFGGSETLMESLTWECEARRMPMDKQMGYAHKLLELLQQEKFSDAETLVYKLGSNNGQPSPNEEEGPD